MTAAMASEQFKVRVIGDRQHGKTELTLAAAASWMRLGQYVVYVTRNWDYANFKHQQFIDTYGVEGMTFFMGAGDKRVEHESGGRIHFMPTCRASRYSGAEVAILDDIEGDLEWTFPKARIIKTYI